MKVLVVTIGIIVLVVGGLWYFNQGRVNQKIADALGSTKVCIEGVSYLQFPKGVTVQYNVDGTIKRCN